MRATAQNAAVIMLVLIYGERWITSTALPTIVIIYQENTMNKDQAKGRIEEAKGKVKQVAGAIPIIPPRSNWP